ncbi:MAG TPA: hypothetical protein VN370_11740 [Desulfitobacteriaceae bacterium]|jgi:uncharacterized protein YoxC|nr:hypothetical protein [Desulfitobacteriaceae bacterium]
MVYEVCALVLTIIFSIVGINLVIVLFSANGLITEVRKALKIFNKNLPALLSDVHCTVSDLEKLIVTTRECLDLIRCKVLSPLYSLASLLDAVKVGYKAWRIVRKEHDESESSEPAE